MSEVHVTAERTVNALPEVVYTCIADYRRHHPQIVPSSISDLEVESGGFGEGTVIRFKMKVGGRVRDGRMRVSEPEPGRVLAESDLESSLVTTFTVSPSGTGSKVRIDTRWQSSGGVAGLMERVLVPLVLRRMYAEELEKLDRYAAQLGN